MIKSNRVKIIPLEQKHIEPLREMRNPPSTWKWLTFAELINQVQQQEWFKKMSLNSSTQYYAIENETKNFIGIIRTDCWDKINRSIRIGIDIHPDYRKKGYGTESFKVFIDYLFMHQNIHRIWFLVAEENKPARKLYKKLGFKEEGTQDDAFYRNGQYHNYIMMRLLEEEYKNSQDYKDNKKLPF